MYKFDKKLHAHTLDGKPLIGTSTVLSVVAKNLVWWAAELAAVECLEAGEKIEGIREEYLLAVASPNKKEMIDKLQAKYPIFKTARFAHFNSKNKKAKEGTDLHAILEHFVKTGEVQDQRIMPFVEWSKANVKRWLWSEAHCYSRELWVGGITDCGAELNDSTYTLIDFKSAKEAFDSHFWQAWGYVIEIEENGMFTFEGESLGKVDKKFDSVCIVPFGAEVVKPQFSYGREDGIGAFKSALHLYKLTNK